MIDKKIRDWRKLAMIDYARSHSRAGSGKLSAPTFSDRYFELLGIISNLQGALNDACDVISAQENLRATKMIDEMEVLIREMGKK